MGILLTDEEMREAYGIEGEYGTMDGVAKAQLKKVVEWIDSPNDCEHGKACRACCEECWESLLKEVEK